MKKRMLTAIVSGLLIASGPSLTASAAHLGAANLGVQTRDAVQPTNVRYVGRAVVVRPGVRYARPGVRYVRPGFVRPGVRWVRPAHYWWRPGGAIVAGAAIGFVAAATAVAWAGPPPAPDACWYYTDPSRTQGFWDVCPY
jgi:hypothetical protein